MLTNESTNIFQSYSVRAYALNKAGMAVKKKLCEINIDKTISTHPHKLVIIKPQH